MRDGTRPAGAWLTALAVAVGLVLSLAGADAAGAERARPLFLATSVPPPPAQVTRKSVGGGPRFVGIDFAALAGQRLRLDLAADLAVDGVIERRVDMGGGRESWRGRIAGKPGAEMVLARSGDALAGSFRIDGRLFLLSYVDGGVHVLVEADPAGFREEAPPRVPVLPSGGATPDSGPPPPLAQAEGEKTRVDLMVAYTAAARAFQGSTAAMEANIALAVSETNVAYENSQIQVELNLVHTVELAQAEFGNSGVDLDRITDPDDGFWDEIHDLRDTYGADMVSLLSEAPEACGLAWVMTDPSLFFEAYAFSVVAYDCLAGGLVLAHELGHNMGSNHDPANAQGVGAYAYSFGYQDPGKVFRTVMAYNCGFPGCPVRSYFSNPDVTYADSGLTTGVADAQDNARSINQTRGFVGAWRSQAIGNDLFADAIAIEGDSGSAPGNNTSATKQGGEADHAGDPGGSSVWWSWTAPWDGEVDFDTAGSDFDTLLAIYTGDTVPGLVEVASNDDCEGPQSCATFQAVQGQSYRIAVDGAGGASGTIQLNWQQVTSFLLIDGDNDQPDVRAYYTDAFDALGISYTIWDVLESGAPGSADLAAHNAALWFSGDTFFNAPGAGPDEAAEAELQAYLDGGGCLAVSSQGYNHVRGLTTFMTGYLGAESVTNGILQTDASGTDGSPFAGIGPFGFAYPADFTSFTGTMAPDGSAMTAFTGTNGPVGLYKLGGAYRTMYLRYGLETVDDASERNTVVQAIAAYCAPAVDLFDLDSDGIPSATELALGLDPFDAADANEDLDGDGLSNLEEVQLGTDPMQADSDGDGTNDGDEVAAGRDPLMNEFTVLFLILNGLDDEAE